MGGKRLQHVDDFILAVNEPGRFDLADLRTRGSRLIWRHTARFTLPRLHILMTLPPGLQDEPAINALMAGGEHLERLFKAFRRCAVTRQQAGAATRVKRAGRIKRSNIVNFLRPLPAANKA